MYGVILNEKDGVATVEMVDTHGDKLVLSNIPMDCLDIGDEVDMSYKEGKVMECRYRYYLIPQVVNKDSDDENVASKENIWRQGQVESVFTAGNDDLMIKFRSRKTERFLLLEAKVFLAHCAPSNKEDYILGVGDKCKNMTRADIRNLMSGCNRKALRQRRRSSEKHLYLSPVGEWMHTTLGKELPLESSHRDGESRSEGGGRESSRHGSESFRPSSGSVQHDSESNSGKKPKSRRMRVEGQVKGRRKGGKDGGSGGDDPSESDGDDGWRPPNQPTDAEDAGYGNKASSGKGSSTSGARGGQSDGRANHERRIPLRESSDRHGRGGGRLRNESDQGSGNGGNNQRSSSKGQGGNNKPRR